jgi:hypothetical protein
MEEMSREMVSKKYKHITIEEAKVLWEQEYRLGENRYVEYHVRNVFTRLSASYNEM